MSPPAAPGHIHPDGWVGACAGEFYQVQVVNGYLEWGGEQSCTNSYEQSLQMLLTAANGDFVDNVYQSKVGNQIALHRSTRCLTLNATTYHEFAYGIANGQQGNPYPAANYFTVNCYIPAEDDGCGANATPAGAPQLAADRPADTAVITATHGGNRPSC